MSPKAQSVWMGIYRSAMVILLGFTATTTTIVLNIVIEDHDAIVGMKPEVERLKKDVNDLLDSKYNGTPLHSSKGNIPSVLNAEIIQIP